MATGHVIFIKIIMSMILMLYHLDMLQTFNTGHCKALIE